MKKTVTGKDMEALGKALPLMLETALAPDNLEPFLKKIARLLSGPDGICDSAKVAITLKGARGRQPINVCPACRKTDLERMAQAASHGSKAIYFSHAIKAGSARAGSISVLVTKPPPCPRAASALVELAAKVIGARLVNETRDAELRREKDLASSLKHIEELYLSFPGISIEEISRAVLDEARRLTGSSLGFAGCIDASGNMAMASLTSDAWDKCPVKDKPVIFTNFRGLWGWVLKRKRPLLTNAAASDKRAAGLPQGHMKIEKFLGVPALSGRRLLGMLALANPQRDFAPEDLDAAQKLARVYAMILQRKEAEDRQRDEDTRFRTIISSTKDTIYTADLTGRLTYISPQAADYGYTPEELIGRSILEFAHPDDRDFIMKAWANAVKTGRTLPILPYRIRRKDGSYAYAEQKSGVVVESGKPLYITGVIRDVTGQKETERLLKESETMMRMVFDTAADAIFIKDMNGMYVKANKASADMMGTTPEAMIGRTDSDYFPPETAAGVFRTDSEVVLKGKTLSLYNYHPFPGGSRHVNIIKTPLKNVRGETIGLLGIARDITDLKRMETELALAHAAEAVSNVARPMAHDFNNALAAINGYATLIDEDLPASSPIKKEISRIVEAVKRAAVLTSKFQDFARNPDIKNPGKPGEKKEDGA
ncbi:MAG: PAS domain S-box protein [Elusimicrobiales bacterium]